MRLATFNILHGRHPADDHVDPALLAAAVRELGADVLALQEVDRNQARSAHADLTAVAAEAMDAADHRFVAALDGSAGATWTAATGDEQPDAAAYGIALLSRYPVRGWQVIRLAPMPMRAPMWFRGSRFPTMVRDEPRVAVAAEIESPLGCVTVVNTHLSFLRGWNRRQLHRVVTSVATAPRPLVLVGDLNMGPAPARSVTGMRALAVHPTFPVDDPREQIDHVLVDGEVTLTGTTAPRLPLSDHRALVVDLAAP